MTALSDTEFSQALIGESKKIRNYAQTYCQDEALAKDFAQETLFRAWRARRSFQAGTNFKAWLYMILRNVVMSHYRSARRERQVISADTPSADSPVPEDQFGRIAAREELEILIKEIPAAQRRAIVAIAINGYSYAELARIEEVAEGTVKSRIARGRILLHRAVTDTPQERVARCRRQRIAP